MFRPATYVDLITHEHRFTAKIYTYGKRLSDILNDRTTDYLRLVDVGIYRYAAPQECVATLHEALIRKDDLHLLIITREEHEAPAQRFFGYVQKTPYQVFLTVPGYEVRGLLYLPPQNDLNPIDVLTNKVGHYFAITKVRATQAGTGEEVFSYPVALVNKHSMTLFSIGEDMIEYHHEGATGEAQPVPA